MASVQHRRPSTLAVVLALAYLAAVGHSQQVLDPRVDSVEHELSFTKAQSDFVNAWTEFGKDIEAPHFLESDKLAPPVALKTFSWNDCSPADSPVRMENFVVSPDPILLNSQVKVLVNVSMPDTAIPPPIRANLQIYKLIYDTWTPVPCPSCSVADLCRTAAHWLRIKCPLRPNAFPFSFVHSTALPPKVPVGLAVGQYRLQADLTGTVPGRGAFHLCLNTTLQVQGPQQQ